MQYNNKDYKPKLHDRWRALTVKNPYATQLVTAAYEDNGIVYGEKCIEVRSKNTPYRGDLMVCSSANPVIPGYCLPTLLRPALCANNNTCIRWNNQRKSWRRSRHIPRLFPLGCK